jgi:hypothetical protein
MHTHGQVPGGFVRRRRRRICALVRAPGRPRSSTHHRLWRSSSARRRLHDDRSMGEESGGMHAAEASTCATNLQRSVVLRLHAGHSSCSAGNGMLPARRRGRGLVAAGHDADVCSSYPPACHSDPLPLPGLRVGSA